MPANIMIPLDFKSLGYNHWTDVEKSAISLYNPLLRQLQFLKIVL